MARSKLNFKNFEKYLAKNREVQAEVLRIVEPKIQASKAKLIESFASHPVSSEISSGPNGSNISGTLGGYGNLFSFIGFSSGDNPVEKWLNFLKKSILLDKKIDTSFSGNGITFKFKLMSITEEDLKSVSPMPWEGGRSWIQAIERGISGFSFYVSKMGAGRSGGGLQSNYPKKEGARRFKNVPYWSKLWNEFLKDISQ